MREASAWQGTAPSARTVSSTPCLRARGGEQAPKRLGHGGQIEFLTDWCRGTCGIEHVTHDVTGATRLLDDGLQVLTQGRV
jgi:hypothetical protein